MPDVPDIPNKLMPQQCTRFANRLKYEKKYQHIALHFTFCLTCRCLLSQRSFQRGLFLIALTTITTSQNAQ